MMILQQWRVITTTFHSKAKVIDYKELLYKLKRTTGCNVKYEKLINGLLCWEDNEIQRRYSNFENVITQ